LQSPRQENHASTFSETCRRVHDLAVELEALLHDPARRSLAPVQVAERLRNEPFRVLVIGEFSRGKSTFLNALVGEKALPSSVRPTTAVITVIRSGSSRSARVIWRDRSRTPTDVEFPVGQGSKALEQFVTAKNQEPEKIAKVEITVPMPRLGLPFELVDTPGVNDIDAQREDITYGYLSRADAAILLLDLQQPLSASEKRFLVDRVLGSDLRKLMFVVNKIDQAPPDSLQRALRYIRTQLDTLEQCRDAPLLPVASKLALQGKIEELPEVLAESRFLDFESELARFLQHASGAGRVRTACLRLIRIARELEAADRMILQSLEGEQAASNAAVAVVDGDLERLARVGATLREQVRLAVDEFRTRGLRSIDERLRILRKEARVMTQAAGFPDEAQVDALRVLLNRGLRDLVALPAEGAHEVAMRVLRENASMTSRLEFSAASRYAPELEIEMESESSGGILAGLAGAIGGIIGGLLLGPIGVIPLVGGIVAGALANLSTSGSSPHTIEEQLKQAFARIAADARGAVDLCAVELAAVLKRELVTPHDHLVIQRTAARQELEASVQMQRSERDARAQAIRARVSEAADIRKALEQFGRTE
jgi:ribosome biogenesis GTPase A